MDEREAPPIRVLAQHPPDYMELLLLSTFSLFSFSPPRTLLLPPPPFSESKTLAPAPTHPAARAKLTLMIMKLLCAVCVCARPRVVHCSERHLHK